MVLKSKGKGVFKSTPFFLKIRWVLILLVLLPACSPSINNSVNKLYNIQQDALIINVLKDCNIYSVEYQYSNGLREVKKSKNGKFIVPVRREGSNIKKIQITCDGSEVEKIELPLMEFKVPFAVIFGRVEPENISSFDMEYFRNDRFFEELKSVVLLNSAYLSNSIPILMLLPPDKEFEIVYRGYSMFKKREFFDYIINNTVRFFPIPEYESFVSYVMSHEESDRQLIVANKLLNYPVKRVFSLLNPYMQSNDKLRYLLLEYLKLNRDNEISSAFLDDIGNNLKKGEYNSYIADSIKLILESFSEDVKKSFYKTLLEKRVYSDLVLMFLPYENLDKELASYIYENISYQREDLKRRLFYQIEPYFSNNVDFYLRMLEIIPPLREEILSKISYSFKDTRLNKYYLEYGRKRPVPQFVLNYLNNLDDRDKEEFLKTVFAEPVIQREIIDLMEKNDYEAFKRECLKIIYDEKHVLNKYIIEKIGETKVLSPEVLIEIYKKNPNKEEILRALMKIGGMGLDFSWNVISKEFNKNEELIKLLFEKGKKEQIIALWKRIDKKEKNLLISALSGIENRKKPVLCDEILDIVKMEKDRELKFAALWAYIYSCQEQYIDNFYNIKSIADEDLYLEMIGGIKDVFNLNPSLQKKIMDLVENLIKEERREKIIDELNLLKGELQVKLLKID